MATITVSVNGKRRTKEDLFQIEIQDENVKRIIYESRRKKIKRKEHKNEEKLQ